MSHCGSDFICTASLLILLDLSGKAKSEDTLRMSKMGDDGDLGSEDAVLKENEVSTEKEEKMEMEREKEVEVDSLPSHSLEI